VSNTKSSRIIFITGTDTGVGKTLLTGLLLHHLRLSGCHALAMKPFCSGSWADTVFLRAIQNGELTLEEITPYFFAEPLAPLVASRRHRRLVSALALVGHIRRIARRCQCLLIEGIGGLLVPLAHDFTVRDLIARLHCQVIVVSRNRLGTINHTLLTVEAARTLENKGLKVVLMSHKNNDASAGSNRRTLARLLAPIPVLPLPFLGANSMRSEAVKRNRKKIQKSLARILA
jgi:dethiobiotin synthetase